MATIKDDKTTTATTKDAAAEGKTAATADLHSTSSAAAETERADWPTVDSVDDLDTAPSPLYQRAGQIRQALNELHQAKTYGQTERVKAARKQLSALGYAGEETPTTTEGTGPVGRAARSDRTTTTTATTGSAAPAAKTSPGK